MVGTIRWGLIILSVFWACYISSESWYPWRDKTDLWVGLAGIGIISLGLIRHAVRTIKKKRAILESKEWAGPGSYYVTGHEVVGKKAIFVGYVRLGLSFIAPLIVAIWLPFNFYYGGVKLPDSRMAIEGVYGRMPEANARAILGPSTQKALPGSPGWTGKGMAVFFFEGKIMRIECEEPECKTADGIRIGDTVGTVEQAYGSGIMVEHRSPQEKLLTYQQENGPCKLSFKIENGLVAKISSTCGGYV